jgi:spoIIIJ-associated protein
LEQVQEPQGTVPGDGAPSEIAQIPPAVPSEPELVRQEVQFLAHHIGIRARVEVELHPEGYYANIHARRSSGIVIGRHGATLEAIGYIVRLMVARHYPNVPKVIVDIAGYRQHRASFLRAKAQAISRIVLENGREMEFEPLTFEEFEVVEDELKKIPGVRAHAVGEGSPRVVIISPIKKDRPETG